jgi:hypothetical protein
MSPFGWGGPSRRGAAGADGGAEPEEAENHGNERRGWKDRHRAPTPSGLVSLSIVAEPALPASRPPAALSCRQPEYAATRQPQCGGAVGSSYRAVSSRDGACSGGVPGRVHCLRRTTAGHHALPHSPRSTRGGGALVITREVVPVDADPRSRVEPTAVQQHARQQVGDLLVAGRGRSALTITLATSRARKTSSGDAGAAVPWRLVEPASTAPVVLRCSDRGVGVRSVAWCPCRRGW